jgi:pSer/pThr/pTyr-binding forkhead associated (FHA) protein
MLTDRSPLAKGRGDGMASLTVIRRLYRNQAGGQEANLTPLILSKDEMVIGRDPPEKGIDLQLPDFSTSRRHAVITHEKDSYWIEDLHTRNGTFVNLSPVAKRWLLHEGDEIQIGPFVLLFQAE